jgi:hypothetical protein
MRRQIEMNAGRRPGKAPPDLSLLDDIVSARVLDAMRTASAQLTKLGVRHALVGGLAVGVHGYPRATKDVDFLVGDEAYQHFAGGLIAVAPGVPIAVGEVPVDPISAAPGEVHLLKTLDRPIPCSGIPVAPIEALVYLKLKSPRSRDASDVVELIKVGAVPNGVDAYIRDNAPDLLPKLADLRRTAQLELESE